MSLSIDWSKLIESVRDPRFWVDVISGAGGVLLAAYAYQHTIILQARYITYLFAVGFLWIVMMLPSYLVDLALGIVEIVKAVRSAKQQTGE